VRERKFARNPSLASRASPHIGVWASISVYRDGMLTQMDRGGNPTINPFINPDGEKDLYNSRQPADDVANYLTPWSKLLENGGYLPDEAKQAALLVLPDILRYDRTLPAHYPNGRVLTDDVYSMRFAWLSDGKVPPTGLNSLQGRNSLPIKILRWLPPTSATYKGSSDESGRMIPADLPGHRLEPSVPGRAFIDVRGDKPVVASSLRCGHREADRRLR
jgi:hypothetical protein